MNLSISGIISGIIIAVTWILINVLNFYFDHWKKRHEPMADRHLEWIEKKISGWRWYFRGLLLLLGLSPAMSLRPETMAIRLPDRFTQIAADTMLIGEKAVFDSSAMDRDIENKYWINPESIPKDIPHGEYLARLSGEPLLQLERTTEGFKVDMRSAQNVRWTPEPKEKFIGWIPVVDIRYE